MSNAKNWVFTLNNYSPDELNSFKELENNHEIAYIIFQAEKGENLTPHIQGYVQFTSKKRFSPAKSILGERVHLEKALGNARQNRDYCSKTAGRLDGPWEYGTMTGKGKRNDLEQCRELIRSNPFIPRLQLLEEFPDVLAKYPRFISACRDTYAETAISDESLTPRPGWQLELSRKLSEEPHPREVTWIYDPVGNSGKSFFSRTWRSDRNERGFIVTGGKHSDIYYAYAREPVVFVDLARTAVEKVPYEVMENFKNGGFLSTKYESAWKKFKTPHVIVFANFQPDLSKLSEDRWNIINL